MPENALWINPVSAKRLGIKDDEMVSVKSRAGSTELKVVYKKGIRQDTVYMASGFGVLSRGLTKNYGKGGCISEILEDTVDYLSGNMAMHETFVSISRSES